jgi:hypothetical protein
MCRTSASFAEVATISGMSTPNPSESSSPEQRKPEAGSVARTETAGIESALHRLTMTLDRPPGRPKASRIEIATFVVAVFALIGVVISALGLIQSVNSAHVDDRRSREQSTREDQRGRYDALSALLINLNSIFIEHPLIQPYFWEKKPIDGTTDETMARTVQGVAVQRIVAYEYVYNELLNMNTDPGDGMFVFRDSKNAKSVNDDWLSWSEDFAAQFRGSPVMCDIVSDPDQKRLYSANFVNALAGAKVCPDLTGYPN